MYDLSRATLALGENPEIFAITSPITRFIKFSKFTKGNDKGVEFYQYIRQKTYCD